MFNQHDVRLKKTYLVILSFENVEALMNPSIRLFVRSPFYLPARGLHCQFLLRLSAN